jgi:hypothetical protein
MVNYTFSDNSFFWLNLMSLKILKKLRRILERMKDKRTSFDWFRNI